MKVATWCTAAGIAALLLSPGPSGAQDSPPAAIPAGPSAGLSAAGPHHIYLVGQLLVTEPWMEPDPSAPDQASAYFTIENRGGSPDRLLGATSDLADAIVFDANGSAPGIGDGSLVIPPHQTVLLQREGVHLLVKGLKRDIANERSVPGVLTFDQAGPLRLDFATSRSDATAPDPAAEEGASLTK